LPDALRPSFPPPFFPNTVTAVLYVPLAETKQGNSYNVGGRQTPPYKERVSFFSRVPSPATFCSISPLTDGGFCWNGLSHGPPLFLSRDAIIWWMFKALFRVRVPARTNLAVFHFSPPFQSFSFPPPIALLLTYNSCVESGSRSSGENYRFSIFLPSTLFTFVPPFSKTIDNVRPYTIRARFLKDHGTSLRFLLGVC